MSDGGVGHPELLTKLGGPSTLDWMRKKPLWPSIARYARGHSIDRYASTGGTRRRVHHEQLGNTSGDPPPHQKKARGSSTRKEGGQPSSGTSLIEDAASSSSNAGGAVLHHVPSFSSTRQRHDNDARRTRLAFRSASNFFHGYLYIHGLGWRDQRRCSEI